MMNSETVILATFSIGVAASIGTSLLCLSKYRRQRQLVEFVEGQILELQDVLAKSRETAETAASRVTEQSRHIAWLESRVRHPKAVKEDSVVETSSVEPQKLTITERRHRVTKLASRGQNIDAIATALGMLKGEVELIVNLSHAAAGR